MNKQKIFTKLACWAGYCLFAGYSSYMTAKSVAMSFELSQVWVVFAFVFIVALVAGFCLSTVIGEMKNSFNPSKAKFIFGLLGFILFWGVSFMTNVHFMLMSNEGLKVVSSELGLYKSYIQQTVQSNKDGLKEQEHTDIALLEANIGNLLNEFYKECEHSKDFGFGTNAVGRLKDIERYFEGGKGQYDDRFVYSNAIFDPATDSGDRGKTGKTQVESLKEKYALRVAKCINQRENVIHAYYKLKVPQTQDMEKMLDFITDSLYVVDVPQITEIATPDVYYQFSKIQLRSNLYDRLNPASQVAVVNMMKVAEDGKPENLDNGKFRYSAYPSARMFSTFNVWDDMMHGRLPLDMKLMGWILFALIVDLIAFILRILGR